MSILSTTNFYSESSERIYNEKEASRNYDIDSSNEKITKEGFSSSMIFNIQAGDENKVSSKLINLTQVIPGSQQIKKIMLPVFYRKNSK